MSGPRDVLGEPSFTLVADGRTLTPAVMRPDGPLRWRDGGTAVSLRLDEQPDGSLDVVLEATGVSHVHEVCLFDRDVAPASVHNHRWYDFFGLQKSTALFLRGTGSGAFVCYANPFGDVAIDGSRVRLWYRPAMDVPGTFRSDPLVVGTYTPTGRTLRRELVAGRDIAAGKVPGYAESMGPFPQQLDVAEARAVRAAVAARVPWHPPRARVSHWEWAQNLFRRDLADPDDEGWAMYERTAQLCAEIGVEHLLVSPSMHHERWDVDGPWQHIMFAGLGLEVARGEWSPDAPEHAPTRRLLDLVEKQGCIPAAYSNPQVLWDRDVRNSVDREALDGYRWACLAIPELRAEIVRRYREFARAYRLGGYSLDFVYWLPCQSDEHGHEPGESSTYAQWDGYRQILAALAEPEDAWVEALIGSQQLLPWGSRDMTHPHPVLGDNQPQWMPASPDLSLHRTCANYQRRMAYWTRNFSFTPSYKIPGQVSHQNVRVREWPVERGWDWAGARFNLLSSIATAPSTTIVGFLPVWDEAEWRGMRERDGAFFREWLDFAKRNARVLSRVEDLFGEPCPGSVDGTIARDDDGGGFVFLANPDHAAHEVEVPVEDGRVLRELHPEPGRLWRGVVVAERHQVGVYEILAEAALPRPAVLGAVATADASGALLTAAGTPGTSADVTVLLPGGGDVAHRVVFVDDGVTPELGPWRRRGGGEVPDLAALSGDVDIETEWVPGAALPDLLAQLAPPVAPEGDERLNPWADPSRLRLFPEIDDPQSVTVRMEVDGAGVDVRQAWVGTWPDVKDVDFVKIENNLLGHYADLSERLAATADLTAPWRIRLVVTGLRPGMLRGVHVAELPRRRTTEFTVR